MIFERIAPEQHDTLDGIPEPAENTRLVGHADASAALASAYRAGKLPHALLFVGPQGIGKATFAYHLAYTLLAHPDASTAPEQLERPDPSTSLFRQMANGAHPSILHLTRPSNDQGTGYKTVITVAEIRRISRFLAHTSHDGAYRIVIVDSADDMNVSAANALLKNLEEPPARTVFILISHSAGRLLPTIRSRCQVVRFNPLTSNDLRTVLEGFDAALPESGTERDALALEAAGSPRTAILLTAHGGLEIASALDAVLASDRLPVSDAHKLADAVAARGQAIAFGLLNDHALDRLSRAAVQAAQQGDLEAADRLSDAWQELRIAIVETETYNLDRKQHALSMIFRLHDLLRM